MASIEDIEETIRDLTQPLNGQYPRPWMSELADPRFAKVMIVGKNQAVAYRVEQVGRHDRYLDALFNRNGQSIRRLHNQITNGRPTRSRRYLDLLTASLGRAGVSEVLETNVICYSTPVSRDLRLPIHRLGRERGEQIFCALLDFVRPSVLISHGTDTTRKLGRVLKTSLPEPPKHSHEVMSEETNYGTVLVLPSLAPPAYNKWANWAPSYLERMAKKVGCLVKLSQGCKNRRIHDTPRNRGRWDDRSR